MIAGRIRDRADDLAEWIAPELNPLRSRAPGIVWAAFAVLAAATAIVLVTIFAWDARALPPGREEIYRARAW